MAVARGALRNVERKAGRYPVEKVTRVISLDGATLTRSCVTVRSPPAPALPTTAAPGYSLNSRIFTERPGVAQKRYMSKHA